MEIMIDQQQKLIEAQQKQLTEQDSRIKALEDRLATIEGKFLIEESTKFITAHVNKQFSKQIDDLQQYSRRSCLIVEGVPVQQ